MYTEFLASFYMCNEKYWDNIALFSILVKDESWESGQFSSLVTISLPRAKTAIYSAINDIALSTDK